MPLTDIVAQKVLNCSVQVDGETQRYGFYDGTLYEFPSDNAGGYHGYPITLEDLHNAGKHQPVLRLLHGRGSAYTGGV